MALKLIGILLLLFGFVDFAGSWFEFDIWYDWLGMELPELVWSFSAYIEMALGGYLIHLSSRGENPAIDDGEHAEIDGEKPVEE
jgi:hypothetical protein